MKVYKVGKKRHPAALIWWTRAGDGGAMVMGSNPARSLDFFFFHFQKFSKLLAG